MVVPTTDKSDFDDHIVVVNNSHIMNDIPICNNLQGYWSMCGDTVSNPEDHGWVVLCDYFILSLAKRIIPHYSIADLPKSRNNDAF